MTTESCQTGSSSKSSMQSYRPKRGVMIGARYQPPCFWCWFCSQIRRTQARIRMRRCGGEIARPDVTSSSLVRLRLGLVYRHRVASHFSLLTSHFSPLTTFIRHDYTQHSRCYLCSQRLPLHSIAACCSMLAVHGRSARSSQLK